MPPQKRKTFYLDKKKEKPVTAGGVILYRFLKSNMELLLVEGRGVYEDLGGRVDDTDKDILTTVSREASEESNEQLNKRSIKKRLKDSPYIYMARSKYVVYVTKATKDEEKLTSSDFGDKEEHDNFYRKIKWIPVDTFLMKDIIQHKLNFRLKNKSLFDKLKEIKNDKKLDFNMLSDTSKSTEDTDENEDESVSESNNGSDTNEESEEDEPIKKKTVKKTTKKITKKVSKKSDSEESENESSDEEEKPKKKSTNRK